LNNEEVQGEDGYSDDEWPQPDLQVMFAGSIPTTSLTEETDDWTIHIDFGANDPNVDISGVQFEAVNAEVVIQTTRFLYLRLFFREIIILI